MNNLFIQPHYDLICTQVAQRIAQLIQLKPDAVLGLATGSTPVGVYAELVRLHREEGLDFSQVVTFNLDEYYPIHQDAPQSYHRFMRERLFNHINCRNFHIPDGTRRGDEQIYQDCLNYEAMIHEAGGLDLQLLGIGRTGHIGFNEPGSPRESRTRLVTLDHITRTDAAQDFFGLENVPVRAITMGIGTILEAREVIMMASGIHKAAIMQQALEGKITSKVPASFLREHPNTLWYLDAAAASTLTEFARPWAIPAANFADFPLRRRALMAASQELDKPLSKIKLDDLERLGAGRLAYSVPSLEATIQEVELDLKNRLNDERHLPRGKKIVCLSPHPDDDVICCGATLLKMTAQGNEVTVMYGVSGSMAVRDKDVLALLRARHPRLTSYIEDHAPLGKSFEDIFNDIRLFIFEREKGEPDTHILSELKRLVREGEAADACRKMGAKPLFLNLPFYQTGELQKNPIGQADVEIVLKALRETQPDIVMLTGEISDPHGTHEMCAEAFDRAAKTYGQEGGQPFTRWNYRGAWEEYQVWEGDYFSIFNKELMERKVGLILDHISQLDPLYPGSSDPREFYERARDRNRATARQLQQLGVLPPSRSYDPIYAEVFKMQPKA
ncbi:MAG: glucosamine-6-phosphate deaminase [Abitibacteriaceae bacterium]|nr:glucosamine-6-phosphate deaminase [Abditibacteriaceae bacterium]MBV9865169.1 glucosamine-6-phosphate deaminase [Abditibacteriaceae bacterium]